MTAAQRFRRYWLTKVAHMAHTGALSALQHQDRHNHYVYQWILLFVQACFENGALRAENAKLRQQLRDTG